MDMLMFVILFSAVLVNCASIAKFDDTSVVAKLQNAYKNRDWDELKSFFTDDTVWMHRNHTTLIGTEAIMDFLLALLKNGKEHIVWEIVKYGDLGNNFAYSIEKVTLKIDGHVDGEYRVTKIWKRIEETWKIIIYMNNWA